MFTAVIAEKFWVGNTKELMMLPRSTKKENSSLKSQKLLRITDSDSLETNKAPIGYHVQSSIWQGIKQHLKLNDVKEFHLVNR
ncbi:unnamed protein product [Lathyrus oleraceus]